MEIAVHLLAVILAYFIAGLVHELGHIFVGLINGWGFRWLVIGPLGITVNQNGKLKLYLEKQMAMWGGVGCIIPKAATEDNLRIWSKVLLGGPIASIVMGMIFLPVGMITGNTVFLLLGAMPMGMGVISILPLPLKTGILYTDGGRWSRLNNGGQKADEEAALFNLAENEATGSDFSKIDMNIIEPLVQSEEAGIRYFGYYYLFRHYKAVPDAERMQLTIGKMEEIKSKVPVFIVKSCKMD